MASITKHKNGWRAQVHKNGTRKSKKLASKTAVKEWASKLEYELGEGVGEINEKRTLEDLLKRYRDNESPKKRSLDWEFKKINHLIKIMDGVRLADLKAPYFAAWRDTRLKSVSAATVNREWNLLNTALNTAVKE
jgi:hypothetical protein